MVDIFEVYRAVDPHDWYFKFLMDFPDLADSMVRALLPRHIRRRLAADPLVVTEGNLVEQHLRQSRSDRVFMGKFKDGTACRILILMEHKSTPDPRLPTQMLGYISALWQRAERGQRAGDPLPVIIPVVIYAGVRKWRVPRSVFDRVAIPRGLGALVRSLSYILVDLDDVEIERLPPDPDMRLGIGAMKMRGMRRWAASRLEPVAGLLEHASNRLLARGSLTYILGLSKSGSGLTALQDAIQAQRLAKTEEDMASIAAELERRGEERGEKRGEERGEKRGKADVLLRLLRRRFDTVPEEIVARMQAASEADLDRWADAFIGARSIEDVFAD